MKHAIGMAALFFTLLNTGHTAQTAKGCKVNSLTHDKNGKAWVTLSDCEATETTQISGLEITSGYLNLRDALSQALIWNLRADVETQNGKIEQVTLRSN